jgi:RND family efflux transporter MFP subunit
MRKSRQRSMEWRRNYRGQKGRLHSQPEASCSADIPPHRATLDITVPVSRLIRRVLIALVLIAGSVALISAWRLHSRKLQNDQQPAVRVTRASVQVKLRLVGKIKARGTAEVKSPVSGRLIHFFQTEGTFVSAGQPIASIRPDQTQALLLSQAQIDVHLKSIKAAAAARSFDRARELSRGGLMPASSFEGERDAREIADQEFALARQQLQIVESQAPRTQRGAGGTFLVLAPVSGVLLTPLVTPGEVIVGGTNAFGATGGTAIIKIADTSAFLVRLNVNEIDINKVRVGMRALVKTSSGEAEYPAHISRVAVEGSTAQDITSFPVDVAFESAGQFRPETSADVDIVVADRQSVLTLPVSAVGHDDRGTFVMLPDGKRHPVTTGAQNEDVVELISGVRENDAVKIRAIEATIRPEP